MALQAYGCHRNSCRHQFLKQRHGALPFGFAFERVIVVVELGYGIGIVCKLKCPFDVVGADDFHPRRLAHCPVFIKRFVHHVPAVNPPFISAHHGMDMVAHPLQKQVASDGIPLVIFKNPIRRLLMPHQRVADHNHVMLLTKVDITVGGGEVVNIGLRMYQRPLQNVFRRNRVEL